MDQATKGPFLAAFMQVPCQNKQIRPVLSRSYRSYWSGWTIHLDVVQPLV